MPAPPRKLYVQIAKDQVTLKGPEDLSEITPSDSTWRNHCVIQSEMSSLRHELLQMQHNTIYDQGAAQEALQDTVTLLQQDTEEIKGNLFLMMDMLRQLHPNLSAPSLSSNAPLNTPNNSQPGRNQQNNEISISPPSFSQPTW